MAKPDEFLDLPLQPPIKIKNNKELADFLEIKVNKLTYYAYHLDDRKKYTTFEIKKRSGGLRKIDAPIKGLKDIHRQVLLKLDPYYKPRSCVFAYIKKRGIVENADLHKGQRWILRIDLVDFFNTITFERLKGLFASQPFSMSENASRTLSMICTKDGHLTQGSPVSPLLSNIICRGLDYKLKEISAKNKCYYSRYADDIFISNNGAIFPNAIAEKKSDGSVELNPQILSTIYDAGFSPNKEKITLRSRAERQIVAGVIVNRKTNTPREYIKSIRATLYSWRKYGLESAEEYWLKHIFRQSPHGDNQPRMRWVLRGQINHVGHVKGYSDPVYIGLAKKLKSLDPTFKFNEQNAIDFVREEIHIYSEGITDRKHLENALLSLKSQGLFTELNLVFRETSTDSKKQGSAALRSLCETLCAATQKHLTICLFDRDEKEITESMGGSTRTYKDHGNNVWSLIIPAPEFRTLTSFCIEHLYRDEQLYQYDQEGRRLYSNSEFDDNQCHRDPDKLVFQKHPNKKALILDDAVIDITTKTNVALPKNKFADYISSKTAPFDDMDFSGFIPTFDQIIEIAARYTSNK
ncbi:reverse transcriptase family protein [Pseudomonas oryzihabitans]|uniref:reverse transcriptase family protein n=1 Tax=Pseudomonas oryzihabitans TaxID=47885 RepID=UPI003CE6B488